MKVSVVYALRDRQIVREIELPEESTIEEALRQSDLASDFPEIDPQTATVGIYGRAMPHGTVLRPGDRVEIYRKLREDPKAARRKRVGKC